MSKLTLEEKRLKALKEQLFGKERILPVKTQVSAHTSPIKLAKNPPSSLLSIQEVSYLKKDLIKVLFLSTLALALQLILYFSLQNNLISFKF